MQIIIIIDHEHNVVTNTIRLMVNTRLDDQYEQLWRASTSDHVRCSSYALFNNVRILEPYISKLGTSDTMYLAHFRCRSNKYQSLKYITLICFMTQHVPTTLYTKNETGY